MRRRVALGRVVVLCAVLGASLLLGTSASATGKGGIPTKVRAVLLKKALAQAAALNDGERGREPSEIQAVRTSEAQAGLLEKEVRTGTAIPDVGSSGASVYVVAMRGAFVFHCHGAHTAGQQEFRQSLCPVHVLVLTVSLSTKKLLAESRGMLYPNLASVGTPVPLEPSRHQQSLGSVAGAFGPEPMGGAQGSAAASGGMVRLDHGAGLTSTRPAPRRRPVDANHR